MSATDADRGGIPPAPGEVITTADQSQLQPICPNCQAPLLKMPERKTKCMACGEFMFVRSTPDDRSRRLMTPNQAELAERLWSAHRDQEFAQRRPTTTVADAVAAQRARMQLELQQARRIGKTVQVYGVDRSCEICGPLDRQVFSSDTPAEYFVPASCPRIARSPGRMLCSICVSAWIKRPDGTSYVDRHPVRPSVTAPPSPTATLAPPAGPSPLRLRPLPSPPEPPTPPRPWWRRIFSR